MVQVLPLKLSARVKFFFSIQSSLPVMQCYVRKTYYVDAKLSRRQTHACMARFQAGRGEGITIGGVM